MKLQQFKKFNSSFDRKAAVAVTSEIRRKRESLKITIDEIVEDSVEVEPIDDSYEYFLEYSKNSDK